MGKNSLLLLGEQVLEPDPAKGQSTGYLLDVQMMAMFGRARQRTEGEFQGLFDQSGFKLGHIIPTASPVSIMEVWPELYPQQKAAKQNARPGIPQIENGKRKPAG